ncbi:hypothetical protein [Phenylobacterium parvum]|uniref:Secreted protein n=1 Tax=Phenylobacterium parvum TaxID=2201350 RepID=A0A2Z3HWB6_9CAUL|nr:hypothetical protein [Phenylobacterium parvum]AWM77099.1 hypothetical protein HYN04_04595 [Phenylobacterium parvum]
MTRSRHAPPLVTAISALVLLAGAAPAGGAPPAGAPEETPPATSAAPPARTQATEAEPKLICEQVQQMGSHFRRKVCATAEAWEARRRKDADQMSRMGDQGTGCGGAANPC